MLIVGSLPLGLSQLFVDEEGRVRVALLLQPIYPAPPDPSFPGAQGVHLNISTHRYTDSVPSSTLPSPGRGKRDTSNQLVRCLGPCALGLLVTSSLVGVSTLGAFVWNKWTHVTEEHIQACFGIPVESSPDCCRSQCWLFPSLGDTAQLPGLRGLRLMPSQAGPTSLQDPGCK